MSYRFTTITFAAALLAAGTALAQVPPPLEKGPPDKAEMQRHFAEMCLDRQARITGDIAALEVKLALSEPQKPLFERWKKIKLAAAKVADCTPPADGKPSLVDGLKHEEKMLRQRLEALKAELPALEALAASLSDEQKQAFGRQHHGPRPGGDHPGDDRPHPDGDHDGPPPEH